MKGKFSKLHINDVIFVPGRPIHDHQLNSIALRMARSTWSEAQLKELEYKVASGNRLAVFLPDQVVEVEKKDSLDFKKPISIYRFSDFEGIRHVALVGNGPIVAPAFLGITVPNKQAEARPNDLIRIEIAAESGGVFWKWSRDNAGRSVSSKNQLKALIDRGDIAEPVKIDIELANFPGVSKGLEDFKTYTLKTGEFIRVWDGIEKVTSMPGINQDLRSGGSKITVEVQAKPTQEMDGHYWVFPGSNVKSWAVGQCDRMWSGNLVEKQPAKAGAAGKNACSKGRYWIHN